MATAAVTRDGSSPEAGSDGSALAWGATDVGRERTSNEDAFVVGSKSAYFAIADGMGGHSAGDIAANIAVRVAERKLTPPNDVGADRTALLDSVCREAHEEILRESRADPGRAGMGATFVVACVVDSCLSIAHVGDARAYLLSEGTLRRLTQDHSVVALMLSEGLLQESDAWNHPRRNEVTRALGMPVECEAETLCVTLVPGNRVLLCSDGIWGALPDSEIAEVLGAQGTVRQIAIQLIGRANHAGGDDNITCVVYEHTGVFSCAGSRAPVGNCP